MAFVGLALVAGSAWIFRPTPPPRAAGFLELTAGGVPGAVEASEEPATVDLTDGSHVVVAPGARWIPTDNRRERFESQLERGRVTFDVRPGGGRRWVIRVGPTTVEVLGTRFSILRERARTTVRVTRGRVAVSDARLSPPRVILTAGETITIEDEPEPAPVPHPPLADVTAPERESDPRPARRSRSRDWRSLAEAGEHGEAYRALGARGLRAETTRANATRLMLLADVARLSGHPAEAVAPLEALLREAPEDPRAPVAAVLLGRICMDELQRRDRARVAFERALAMPLPRALRPDVERRLRRLSRTSPED